MKYKFLEHTADIKFQAFGQSIEEVFKNASFALKEIIVGKETVEKKTEVEKEISVSGKDKESLLYNFLEEFLYLFETEGFLLGEVKEIDISKNNLIASVLGSCEKQEVREHVKAITYSEMFVKEQSIRKPRWVCQVVVDV